jgi:tetratricopeptide (TPR) repeat protein
VPENPRIDELRRRIDMDPASIAFAELAEEYRRAQRVGEAIQTCRIGLARHPSYLSARVTLGRCLMEINDLESAQAELEQVRRVAPQNVGAIQALAEVYERRGLGGEALECYRTALDLAGRDPSLRDAVSTLARQIDELHIRMAARPEDEAPPGGPAPGPSNGARAMPAAPPLPMPPPGGHIGRAPSAVLADLERLLLAVRRERARRRSA